MPVTRVRFLRPYIFTPAADRRVSVKFKPAGGYVPVTRECAKAAVAAGAAELPPEGLPPAPRVRVKRPTAPRARTGKVIKP